MGIEKPSASAMRKLAKGGTIRVKMGEHPIHLHGHRIRKIMNAFKKNKGINLAMSPEEIEHNHGAGFFDDLKRGFTKHIIEPTKKVAKQVETGFNEHVKPVIKQVAPHVIGVAQEMAGPAAAAAVSALGSPELAPVAAYGAKMAAQEGGKHANKAIEGWGIGDYIPDSMEEMIRKPMNAPRSRNIGHDIFSPLARATKQHAMAAMEKGKDEALMAKARITGRSVGYVGAGGNLMGLDNPATVSQPYGENFQFIHTMPPAYSQIKKQGGGLYGGAGLGGYGLYAGRKC